MATLTVPVTEDGIVVPSSQARRLGYRPGGWAEIELHPLSSSEELQEKALYYTLHRLGTAVFVGDPVWVGDGWSLPVKVRGLAGTFGQVFLTRQGDVLESRSTSLAELEEAICASGAGNPPTE